MRIAFTHNLQTDDSWEQAEYDSPATVLAITRALENLGHRVEALNVNGAIDRTIRLLERIRPDLVFNTAEGSSGKCREALFPAIFEHLGLPFTGSDAYVCTVTMDKNLTKLLAKSHGVPAPASMFVTSVVDLAPFDLRFPVIVKPNFEGSSMGISQDSIVESGEALRCRIEQALEQFPSGLLVEEYIDGTDLVVPFLEAASPETGGVLRAFGYAIDLPEGDRRKYNIYDFELKHSLSDAVNPRVLVDLPPALARKIGDLSRKLYGCLGIRDFGRIDLRVSAHGEPFFLEANALPSLEPGAGIYAAAVLAGLPSVETVLGSILRSALNRESNRRVPHPFAKRKGGIKDSRGYAGWRTLHPTLFQKKEKSALS